MHPSCFGGGAGGGAGGELLPRSPPPPPAGPASALPLLRSGDYSFFVLFLIIIAVVIITIITVILFLLPFLPLPRQPPRCCRTRLRCCLRRCPLLPGPGAQVRLGHPPLNTPFPRASGLCRRVGARERLSLEFGAVVGRGARAVGVLRTGRAGVSGWDAPRIPGLR